MKEVSVKACLYALGLVIGIGINWLIYWGLWWALRVFGVNLPAPGIAPALAMAVLFLIVNFHRAAARVK